MIFVLRSSKPVGENEAPKSEKKTPLQHAPHEQNMDRSYLNAPQELTRSDGGIVW